MTKVIGLSSSPRVGGNSDLLLDELLGGAASAGFPGRKKLPKKQVALIVTMGDSDPKTAHPTVEMFRFAFDYLGMKLHEPLVVMAMDRGEVKRNKAALEKARDLGRRLAAG